MKKLIIATGNRGKLKEFREILSDLSFEITSLADHWDPVPSIEETGATFYENARIKADWVFNNSGVWALADDSGLEVDVLNGEPGVHSARFAGDKANAEENNRKLLKALEGVPQERRTARFRCVLVLKTGMNQYRTVDGVCEGQIGAIPTGSGGFGYDPLFIPVGYECSFAELGSTEKNLISHRGQALKKLRKELNDIIA